MKVALVIPQLVSRANDVLGSGIYYMPISMAYLAAVLREDGHDLQVLDMFAIAPHQVTVDGQMLYQGASFSDLSRRLNPATKVVFIFSWGATSYKPVIELIQETRRALPSAVVAAVENSQAVFALSLGEIAPQLLQAGAHYVILGEAEARARTLCRHIAGDGELPADGLSRTIQGEVVTLPPQQDIRDLDALPFPAWDLFPLEAYWDLGYAHGPREGRYLAILTSRGCTFGCRFCVIPATNFRRWRARTPENVFAEMRHWYNQLAVAEFHLEDVNPTIDRRRLARLGDLVRESGLPIVWKLVSGTKIETVSESSLRAMAAGGCTYVSFSPESGSPRVLRLIDKPFDHQHALGLVRVMRQIGVWSQAVFILGFPSERDEDRQMSMDYMAALVKAGLDEVLVLITSPIPGAAIVEQGLLPPHASPEELSFAPVWRPDYPALRAWQQRMYRRFFLLKILHQPGRTLHHFCNLLRRRFKTKMEMTFWRLALVRKDMLLARLVRIRHPGLPATLGPVHDRRI